MAYGLTGDEMRRLSRYNNERDHGVAHTSEYDERMAELQGRYNKHVAALPNSVSR